MSPLQRTFWLGAGLIVLSNALALGGVYYNRSGEPESLLRLSEREVSISYGALAEGSDHAGQVLTLDYRLARGWVNNDTLRALGFEVGSDVSSYSRDRVARDGLVVLELNGEQYQAEVASAKAELKQAQDAFAASPQNPKAKETLQIAEYELGRLQASSTRLYVVDAGLDGSGLRQRYSDRSRYSLARASLRMGMRWTPGAPTERDYTLYVDLPELSVPGQWRNVFNGWQPYVRSDKQRHKASIELAFGKRFEPWVVEAKRVE